MNIENLKRAYEYIKTIPDEKFNMLNFRDYKSSYTSAECGSVGCIIGHCTILDADNWNKNYSNDSSITLSFLKWSMDFFDLPFETFNIITNREPKPTKNSKIWDYIFHDDWGDYPRTNTIDHALYRMKKIIDGYKPFKLEIEILNHGEK